MAELAALKVAVTADTSNLVKEMAKANVAMEKIPASAKVAEKALDNFGKKVEKGFDEVAAGAKALEAINKKIDASAAAALGASVNLSKIGNAAPQINKLQGPIVNVQRELAKASIEAQKLDSKLGKGLVGSSNTAGQALMNLGRVAQDAPFGFIGIANNLNPLLESFQRLKVETGSTSKALKSLAGSMVGAGGVGIALSLIVGAVQFAQLGFSAWTRGLEKNREALKKNAESYNEIIGSLAKEQIKVDLIVQALKTETLTREQRNEAVKQLQAISPAYFSTLDKENASITSIAAAYDRYTQSIIRSISAKLKEKDLTDITEKILKLQEAGRSTGNGTVVVNGKLLKVQNAQLITQNKINQGGNLYQQYQKNTIGLTQQQVDELENLRLVQKQLLEDIANSQGADPFIKLDKTDAKKKTRDIRTVQDVLDELRLKIRELNTEEFTLNTDNAQERVSAFLGAIKELAVKFKLDPQGNIIQGIFDDAKFAKLGFIVENGFLKMGLAAKKAFSEQMKDLKLDEPIPISFKVLPLETGINGRPDIKNFTIDPVAVEEATALAYLQGNGITKGFQDGIKVGVKGLRFPELVELAKSYRERLAQWDISVVNLTNDMVVGTFSAIGEALGNAASGMNVSDIFGGFFKTILGALGAGIQQLGLQMLAANKAIKLAKNFLGKAPGVAASVGLIALGTIIKALSNNIKVPGFANGVQNFSGGLAMVGERGPELVNLPRGSDVIPNHELSGSFGGQSVFIPEARVKGQDIVIAFNRASATNSRNGF